MGGHRGNSKRTKGYDKDARFQDENPQMRYSKTSWEMPFCNDREIRGVSFSVSIRWGQKGKDIKFRRVTIENCPRVSDIADLGCRDFEGTLPRVYKRNLQREEKMTNATIPSGCSVPEKGAHLMELAGWRRMHWGYIKTAHIWVPCAGRSLRQCYE